MIAATPNRSGIRDIVGQEQISRRLTIALHAHGRFACPTVMLWM